MPTVPIPGLNRTKALHEVRDAIHGFVRLDSDERRVLDSKPLQRLRHIHQLAMTYLVYPGATHRRFEHSVGVMELAGRVFDVVTRPENVSDEVRGLVPEINGAPNLPYWRRVIRMAALCHDLGHLPFSHASEGLLPRGWNHERLTKEIIGSEQMSAIWREMTPPIRPEQLAKLAIGPGKEKKPFTMWEAILSEVIVGDAFGVDRMDYLLRDSHHVGVPYGKFDHERLIDSLRILRSPSTGVPELGIELGGIHTAEALLVARYFIYSQVYFHPVRRIYDIHLKDFLRTWLPGGKFAVDVDALLQMTDNEVIAAIREAAANKSKPGHDPAKRILDRGHYRDFYTRHPTVGRRGKGLKSLTQAEIGGAVFKAAKRKFGHSNVKYWANVESKRAPDFPVLLKDGKIFSSLLVSETLKRIPLVSVDYVFVVREAREQAKQWLETNRSRIAASCFKERKKNE